VILWAFRTGGRPTFHPDGRALNGLKSIPSGVPSLTTGSSRKPAAGLPAGLAKRNSDQAGAQQHETGRRQREETVGHKVMFTHVAPAARDAGPNLLKISESALSQKVKRYCVPPPKSESRKEAVICMGKKNAGANQAHERCNCLDHRNVQSAPARTQRLPRCTVKRIPSENRKWAPTDDLAQQFRQWRAAPGARAADGGGGRKSRGRHRSAARQGND
jgi:hypothetical protein